MTKSANSGVISMEPDESRAIREPDEGAAQGELFWRSVRNPIHHYLHGADDPRRRARVVGRMFPTVTNTHALLTRGAGNVSHDSTGGNPPPPPVTGLSIGVSGDSLATAGNESFLELFVANHDAADVRRELPVHLRRAGPDSPWRVRSRSRRTRRRPSPAFPSRCPQERRRASTSSTTRSRSRTARRSGAAASA